MAKSLETVYLKDGQVDVAHYHDLALQKQKEHAKFLATLKKKKPKHLDQLAIMPSKYTDEIENSSYTWRGFLCLENQNIV
ncbi:hypothetical protein M5361_13115 [Ligilactobacillus agilis]|nr:hypothetical protein [Ligilactobacillus agilis]